MEAWNVRNSRKLLGLIVEERLVARKIDRHHHQVGEHDLCVVAQVGLGNDQRILHRRARARRKQTVEAAVERDACNDRDEDGGRRRDDREHSDDTHVQPRTGAAGTTRLHDLPDLAGDDAEQERNRHRIGEQQRHDDVVTRRDRREVGEDDEGDERREHATPTAIGPRIRPSPRLRRPGASVGSAMATSLALMAPRAENARKPTAPG